MNGLVILLILLLIVPAQIYFNYIVSSRDEAVDADHGRSEKKRATNSLSDVLKRLEDSISYYSTFDHLKEFFVVPHKRRSHNNLKKKFLKMFENLDQTTSNQRAGESSGKARRPGSRGNHLDTPTDVSEAKEVEQYNHDSVYFARSLTPRASRPAHLRYRVGEVIKHKQDDYHGVIIGWDLKCLAPDWWLHKHGYYTDKGKQGFINHPHYLVLVESEDEDKELLYYIPQQHLRLDDSAMVKSPHVSKYFQYYSGRTGSYVAKDWLKEKYPND